MYGTYLCTYIWFSLFPSFSYPIHPTFNPPASVSCCKNTAYAVLRWTNRGPLLPLCCFFNPRNPFFHDFSSTPRAVFSSWLSVCHSSYFLLLPLWCTLGAQCVAGWLAGWQTVTRAGRSCRQTRGRKGSCSVIIPFFLLASLCFFRHGNTRGQVQAKKKNVLSRLSPF
jgi:hypothetical protein